jgi:hypothetical protein
MNFEYFKFIKDQLTRLKKENTANVNANVSVIINCVI